MSTANGLRFTFQKKLVPELQSLQKEELSNLLGSHIKQLVRIQAQWRGYKTR